MSAIQELLDGPTVVTGEAEVDARIALKERARAELDAMRKRSADLLLMLCATRSNEYAAPLWVEDEPGRGRGWAVYFHDERYVFIPADQDNMPVIDGEALSALRSSEATK